MSKGIFNVPFPVNEPVLDYEPGSPERAELKKALDQVYEDAPRDIPMIINGKAVHTNEKREVRPPHKHQKVVGKFSWGGKKEIEQAIQAAQDAKPAWEKMPWDQKAAIFLKAADLISGPYRARINAATMVGQSKNAYQAEIDSACELIDFLRFNVSFAEELYNIQPFSSPNAWNRLQYRPLEGFILAITPFNFTAIAGNLPMAPALMGNTVVWKPSDKQILSAQVIMEIFQEAGLPDGVINMVFAPGQQTGDLCFAHPDFGGVHFTGSTGVFQNIWKSVGENIRAYKSYPRIVGETGGKDFVIMHESADEKATATALVRGAFEYQGQKCSAASRAYIPRNRWEKVKEFMVADLDSIKMGPTEDFGNFINAVIDENSFDKLSSYIDRAKKDDGVELIAGGNYDKSEGWFIEPTVFRVDDPLYVTMCEELFGPVLTIYVYDPKDYEETLNLLNRTSVYGLTGAVLSTDRQAVELAKEKLTHSAGNFYINDKPTGAVVGQQPFGGSRASGTNDKAGSIFNLIRWVSPRTIKETFVPATDYRYPFLEKE